MSDHHLAQTRPALFSALQDRPFQIFDAVRTQVIPRVSKRIELVRSGLSKVRGKPSPPEMSKPVLLIPGRIDRRPSDGWSVIVVAAGDGYLWQIRKYGCPVTAHACDTCFDKVEEAWKAGVAALDRHRGVPSEPPASS